MTDKDRDGLQRDLHKFQTDREYLRKLGELALASSLNSLTKNVAMSVASDRTSSSENSPPVPPERDESSHFHRSASMVVDRNRLSDHGSLLSPSPKSLLSSESSKELNYGSLKHRTKYATVSEKKHRNSSIETNDLGFVIYEDAAAIMSGRETIRRHYHSAVRKYESLKEEYDFLHKRYADLVTGHSSVVFKLELAQEDLIRMRKNYEEIVQEKNSALRDRAGLQQQCTAAIRQWDKALRECNEVKERLAKVQQQRDDAMKEVNEAMTWRIKATKDLARLTEERNEAVNEYSLVMSERDSVHKEIEKLQDELHETQKKLKISDDETKRCQIEVDNVKKEALAAVFEKQRLLKENLELKERCSELVGISEDAVSPTSPSRSSINATPLGLKLWGSSSSVVSTSWTRLSLKNASSDLLKHNHLSASNSSSISTMCSNSKLKLDLEQANQIVELRRQVDRLRHDQLEAQQEVEVFKRRLEWAFSEKEKIALERESIRYLCDRLRKERDQIVTKFAKSLAECDEVKRQRNEAQKEVNSLKKILEGPTNEGESDSENIRANVLQFL
ncbi:Disks large -like protein 5 [Halotydeus destructor]|nr:Disks large -like protein 5 [Halotydeus destructor]